MSETLSPTPGAVEPGPTPGTQAPVAEATPNPAPLSTEPVVETPAAAVETVAETPAETTDAPTSILSEAQGEAPVVEEAAKTEEVKAEETEEAKAEEPEQPKEPLAPPVYDKFELPEGVTLAEDKLGVFAGTLGEFENRIATDPTQAHAAFQELGQKLVNLYVEEVKEAHERSARFQKENWERTIDEWQQKFRDDPEIGKNRQNTTLQRIGGLLNLYGQQTSTEAEKEVRDAFALTGAGNHPAILRWAHWAASRLTETPRVVVPQMPRTPMRTEGSRAQRLYKNTVGAA